MKKNTTKTILTAVAAICFLLGLSLLVFTWYTNKRHDEEAARLAELAAQATPEPTVAADAQTEPTETAGPEIPVDFAALQAECPDIYAWLSYPGLDIEQPIVQSATDNELYLRHDIYGQYFEGGTVYTENYNSKDFSDFMTVIYGHNMNDGSMFAPLHQLEDPEVFDKYNEFVIYTPDKIYHYQVLGAVYHTDEHLLLNYDYSTPEGRTTMLQTLRDTRDMNSNVNEDVYADESSKLVILSTCGATSANRYLVVGVLTEVEG